MTPAPLEYALVARPGPVVLAEHSLVTGNASLVAISLLEKLPQQGGDARASYISDKHVFHILVSGGLIFLCMADEAAGKRVPFAFLQDVKERFLALYSAVAHQAVAYEFNSEFSQVLAQRLEYFNTSPQADTIGRVQGELGQLKNIMVDNIDKILDRGERLELLVARTDHLAGDAIAFKREARRLKGTMWWRHARMTGCVVLLVVLLAYALVAIICSPTLHC